MTKANVLGVLVDVTNYDDAVDRIVAAAEERRSYPTTALAVHGLMTAVADRALRAMLNRFSLVTPDGQPVRWAMNQLHGAGLRDRVYGPDLTLAVAEACARRGLPVYLYGSTPEVSERFEAALLRRAPGLVVAGREPSRFRESEPGEAGAIAARIRASGARVVLVGLGCPRQEIFVWAVGRHLDLPLLAVGAAFDYHAGNLRKPPPFAQRHGLEWLWRLVLEPRRLWRRYLILNPLFLGHWLLQATRLRRPDPELPEPAELERFPV